MTDGGDDVDDRSVVVSGVVALDGTVRTVDDAVLAFADLDRSDVVGEPLWESGLFDGQESRSRVEAAVDRTIDGEVLLRNVSVRAAEGRVPVALTVRPHERDDGKGLVVEGLAVPDRGSDIPDVGPDGEPLGRSGLLVAYELDDEPPSLAVVRAFLALDVDVFDGADPLAEHVDVDALDRFDRTCGGQYSIATRIWDHPVVITPNDVRIYADG